MIPTRTRHPIGTLTSGATAGHELLSQGGAETLASSAAQVKPSGDDAMDQSVLAAARAVRAVTALPRELRAPRRV